MLFRSDVQPDQIGDGLARQICDAFGLFGSRQECLSRLQRAEEEAGVDHVFIFPSHTVASGYDMPYPEVRAFRDAIFPGLGRSA